VERRRTRRSYFVLFSVFFVVLNSGSGNKVVDVVVNGSQSLSLILILSLHCKECSQR